MISEGREGSTLRRLLVGGSHVNPSFQNGTEVHSNKQRGSESLCLFNWRSYLDLSPLGVSGGGHAGASLEADRFG